MTVNGLPVTLDQALPFVQAVQHAAQDPRGVDLAAQLLRQLERFHGIEVLCEFSPDSVLPAGTFQPREAPLSYRDILALLGDWDEFQREYKTTKGSNLDSILHPFLSATQLILQGIDFTNNHFIRTADGTLHAWSQRA